MTCKEDYEKIVNEIFNDAYSIRSMNKEDIINNIKDIIQNETTLPLESDLTDISKNDAAKILSSLKRKEWTRKEDSILCRCIRNEGLNQENAEQVIGTKYSKFARNTLRTLL